MRECQKLGRSYTAVSADLTGNPPTLLNYGTITTLEISPADPATYYAGTDNGHVWRSTNSGSSWTEITGTLPLRWVTRVSADPIAPATVYVTLSGFTQDVDAAEVFRSTDRGAHWQNVSGNLPDVPANDVVVDPADTQTLYLATDTGVWLTRNLGALWVPLGQGMPVQTVYDLTLHAGSRTLVAATHGRSMWRLDLGGLPLAVSSARPTVRLAMSPPYPNPSRGMVRLELDAPSSGPVDAAIYDANGRRVATLVSRMMGSGSRTLTWDGRHARGERVAPGVYFARARAAGAMAVRRVVRMG